MVSSSLFRGLGVLLLIGCAALIGCSDSAQQGSTGSALATDPGTSGGAGNGSTGSTFATDAMITRVDLTSSSLNLSSHNENVVFDESTVAYRLQPVERSGNPGSMGAGTDHIRIPLSLSDFSLGDTIRISAEIMDESTIKALEIELAGEFHDPWFDIQFTDRLASIDTLTREVTFQNNPFGGILFVCPMLNDADGNWLWLADFNTGELIDVKGHTIEGGVFEIMVMQKVAE
jgi:hypothetical protein